MDPPSSGYLTSISLSIKSLITLVGLLGGLNETASEWFLTQRASFRVSYYWSSFDFYLLPTANPQSNSMDAFPPFFYPSVEWASQT